MLCATKSTIFAVSVSNMTWELDKTLKVLELLEERGLLRCLWCGAELRRVMCTEPHDSGFVTLNGVKLWAWIECPKCGYQWALWKLFRLVCARNKTACKELEQVLGQ